MLDRIETTLANIISVIIHPLLLPTYSLIILFNMQVYFSFGIPTNAKWMIGVLVFILSGLLPMLMILLMTKLKIIESLQLSKREERLWPFVISAISYYLCYFLIKQLNLPSIYIIFMLGAFVTVTISLMISFFWKISVHMVGIGGVTGAFTGLSLKLMLDLPMLIILLILLSGLTGFARLKLLAHNPAQVLGGFVVGFGVFMLLMLYR